MGAVTVDQEGVTVLICVEEHTTDPEIDAAALPEQDRLAPYRRLQSSANAGATSGPQAVVEIREAMALARDLDRGRLADMDAAGIDVQVVSYSSPVQLVGEDRAVDLARTANDRLAGAVAAHPDRFRGFAMLPWQSPSAAADELERAVTELGLVGTLLMGSPGTTFLDDHRYDAVLAKHAELGVPIYLHPFVPRPEVQRAYYAGLPDSVTAEFSLAAWGWHHEAGIHVLRLLLSGAFDRHPGLQVISGHWGEMVPFFLSRLDQVLPPSVTGLSATVSETYRTHVWVTPSGIFDAPHVSFVRDTVGLDRVLWSVDYPYITMPGTREFLDVLQLDDADKERISSGNARRLFRIE